MRILLTGSSGFVGQNLSASLRLRNVEVLEPSSSELNLLDPTSVSSYLEGNDPDLIVHAAGKVGGIQANIDSQSRFLVENTQMGFNLLTMAKYHGVPRVLNLASSCIYPAHAKNPLREESLLCGSLEPTNEGYALAKISVMKLGLFLSDKSFGCKTVVPCNLFGPYDHFDEYGGHMIPALVARIHRLKDEGVTEISLWGSGEARREFMYIEDFCDALLFIIDRFEDVPAVLNCGIGRDYTIRQYYESILEIFNHKIDLVPDLTKPEGMKQKLVDCSILAQMGWTAQTSLVDGLVNTIQYFRESLKNE